MSDYLARVRAFSRNARLYLVTTSVSGFLFGIQYLFFNLYVLSLGYDQAFVGILASVPALVTGAFAIPIGLSLRRIGYRRGLLTGMALQMVAIAGWALLPGRGALVAASALSGLGISLSSISLPPFLVVSSREKERTHLFSVQFALNTLFGVAGSLAGGVLPQLFSSAFGIPAEGAAAYRATLLLAMGLAALAFLPLVLIRGGGTAPIAEKPGKLGAHAGVARRLLLIQVAVGLGAGILMPFVNVFYKLRFHLPDPLLGSLFAAASLCIALGGTAVPLLAERLGKVRTMVLLQSLSIPFLVLMGFSPVFSLSAMGYLVRTALMNMGSPVFSSFAMGAVPERSRALVSSLLVLGWSAGWGVSAWVSGRVQVGYGFSPIFLVTASLYALSIAMTYLFFRRTKEESEPEKAEAVLSDEQGRV